MENMGGLLSIIGCCAFDIFVYSLIEAAVKQLLKGTSDIQEKRQIWMLEGVVLFIASLLIYLHHTPYILIGLASLTVLYTQLVGRVDFRYVWWQITTRWDEFQQHEESMEQYNMKNRQHNMVPPPNVQVTLSNTIPHKAATTHQQHMPVVSNPVQQKGQHNTGVPKTDGCAAEGDFEAWYPEDGSRYRQAVAQSTAQPAPQAMWYPQDSRAYQSNAHNQSMGGPTSSTPSHPVSSHMYYYKPNSSPIYPTPSVRYNPVVPQGVDLARRPLYSYLATPAHSIKKDESGLSMIKSKVMSAFGVGKQRDVPPGLPNSGQNLCFLNSVLQCLAHSPGLTHCLVHESHAIKSQSQRERELVSAITKLFQELDVMPGTSQVRVLDHTAFREAASHLRDSVVQNPAQAKSQNQQDAAEFLMWVLEHLHTAFNNQQAVTQNSVISGRCDLGSCKHGIFDKCDQDVSNSGQPQRYQNMALGMLKFIYGDLTAHRVKELKTQCRKEIEQANGLESDSYAEPIQRLSDLEWLTYKELNNSSIDDIFTGQLVEAQHCLACNRISVSIQTFNILPVPIVEPRQLNGIVYLEDCFTKFGNIEDLFGPEGLICESCNQMTSPVGVTPHRQGSDPRLLLKNAAAASASPVLSNGGGAVDSIRRRHVLKSDSALHSTLGQSAVSPIHHLHHPMEGLNDSGFADNQVKTSTPVQGAAPQGITQQPSLKRTDGQKRSLLRQLPDCLIVQLMRFSFVKGQSCKVKKPVSIPLFNLDLTHLVVDKVMHREDLTALHSTFRYELFGVCLHIGGDHTSYGHYIAYSKAANGTWYKFDDEEVTAINMEYELNTRQVRENAYLLFYRKSYVG